MANFGIAINTSYGFFVDRDNGIFYEFLTYPMTRGQFLVGKIVFNCLLSLVQASLTLALAVGLLGIPIYWQYAPLIAAGVVAGTAGWFFFLSIFALRIRRNDMFNTVLNLFYFVFMFASTLFYPLDGMPAWLRVLSLLNPLTWHTDALRYLTIGVGSPLEVAVKAGGFLVFLVISFTIAVRTLQRAVLR
jgi:ABC-2 type transport system permease protein